MKLQPILFGILISEGDLQLLWNRFIKVHSTVFLILLAVGCQFSHNRPNCQRGDQGDTTHNASGCLPFFFNEAEALKIYWRYRLRLKQSFLVSSSEDLPGTNLPAANRNPKTGEIRWGDATIHLANYVSVLATEYRLQTLKGHHTAQTLNELFYAMRTYNRLDRIAESCFRQDKRKKPGDLNGFFIRDDVPYNFSEIHGLTHPAFKAVPKVKSDYIAEDKLDKEMSQDQVWYILTSMALVCRLLPNKTMEVYSGKGRTKKTGVNFPLLARKITFRIISHMQKNDWRIVNPVTHKPVDRGAGDFLTFGFAEAANTIMGPGIDFQSPFTRGEKWKFDLLLKVARYYKRDYYLRTLCTVADYDAQGQGIVLDFLIKRFQDYHDFEHFPMIYVLLHGGIIRNDAYVATIQGLLACAPKAGPYKFAGNDASCCEWSSTSRLDHPERNDIPEESSSGAPWFAGEFNGLDYMLLHNLYALVFGTRTYN